MEYWSGRVDGNDSDILRIHQVIQVKTLDELMQDEYNGKKVCFVSYNSNEGIRRNNGRLGAADGWKHLKSALSNFPIFDTDIKFYDLKDPIDVVDGKLEEAQMKLADVVAKLKSKGVKEVILMPFMFVAGDHANNDIAEDWNNDLKEAGFTVSKIILEGLGQNPDIQNIYIDHAKFAAQHKPEDMQAKKVQYANDKD